MRDSTLFVASTLLEFVGEDVEQTRGRASIPSTRRPRRHVPMTALVPQQVEFCIRNESILVTVPQHTH